MSGNGESHEERLAQEVSAVRRARLRQALDREEQQIATAAGVPELTGKQAAMVTALIDEMLNEPFVPLAQMVEVLESLIDDPELSYASVYRCIDDQLTITRNRIAQRAFLLGFREGSEAAQAAAANDE